MDLAAQVGDLDHVKQLLTEYNSLGLYSAFVDLETFADYGLFVAARYGQIDVVKWFIETGASHIEHVDVDGKTVLLYVARWGSLDMVQWLVKTAGSNIEHKDRRGKTALQHSIYANSHVVTNWLLTEAGCRMDTELWLELRPALCEIPIFLLRCMLLESPAPEFMMTIIIRHSSDKKSVKSMFANANELRTLKPDWLKRKCAIVTDSLNTSDIPNVLIILLLSYSVPSVEEIWSMQLGVKALRRNPVRATRKRRA